MKRRDFLKRGTLAAGLVSAPNLLVPLANGDTEMRFGDGWEHGIVLEKQLPADPNTTYPHCTDGKLACPPEDCGGIPVFYDLLHALDDPNHERHEELSDWIGDDFDPQAFSVDSVNQRLAPKRRRSSTTKK